ADGRRVVFGERPTLGGHSIGRPSQLRFAVGQAIPVVVGPLRPPRFGLPIRSSNDARRLPGIRSPDRRTRRPWGAGGPPSPLNGFEVVSEIISRSRNAALVDQVAPQPATMAATNKCLAQNNKSRHVSRATIAEGCPGGAASVVTPESCTDEHGQWRNQVSIETEMKTFVREKFGASAHSESAWL